MFSALLAAAVAIVILRRQFNHDRSLAGEQRKADIELLRVEVALPYIQQLGNALIDMGRTDYRTHAGKSGQAVWGSDEPQSTKDFYQVWTRLENHVTLPNSELVWDLWRDLVHRWKACHQEAQVYVTPPAGIPLRDSEPEAQALGLALDLILYNAEQRAIRAGSALLAWDGMSDLDLHAAIGGYQWPARNTEERRLWRKRLGMQFAQNLRHHLRLYDDFETTVTYQRLVQKIGPGPNDRRAEKLDFFD